MKKSFWMALMLLAVWLNWAAAQSLTKKAEGVFISDAMQGKIAMKSNQRLVIDAASTLSGELILTAGGNDCHFSYQKLLKTPTKVEAAQYAEAIKVEIDQQKDVIILSLRAPASPPWSGTNNSGRLMIEVTIPANCPVEVNSAYFDITAVGPFSEFIVPESLSKVQVEKVRGNVEIKVSNRPLVIKDVTGAVTATNKYDKLRLENIDTGDKLATIRNEHGEISIDGLRGELDARTSYDNIVAQNLFLYGSKNSVKNISALISLSFDSLTTGKIRVNNQYEHIIVEIKNRVDAQFICKVGEDATVSADHMDIVPVMVDENRLEFISGEGTAEIRLYANGSGNITINRPKQPNVAGGK